MAVKFEVIVTGQQINIDHDVQFEAVHDSK